LETVVIFYQKAAFLNSKHLFITKFSVTKIPKYEDKK